MSEESVSEETPMTENEPTQPKGVILMSYPKIVFMWPSWLTALICGITMWLKPDLNTDMAANVCWIFMIIFTLNLVVLSFDFPRATSFSLFAIISACVLLVILAFKSKPDLLPIVGNAIANIKPVANATFFFIYFLVMTVIYGFVAVLARFDYWEVRPNELLHHHGMLSDLERFSAPHLRIDKEINDIFEYMLLGSGRLILQPSGEKRAIILDNIFFISSKEKRITKLLGALQVQVRQE